MIPYTDYLVVSSLVAEGTNQLDGTDGKGLFGLHTGISVVGVLGHSSIAVNWTVDVEIPNPADPLNPVTYRWMTFSAQADFFQSTAALFPKDAKIIVKTNAVAGANPRAQILTSPIQIREH